MIHFSGTFQLAAINKEDTTKSGDKVVYFTCFSRRGDQSDRVFCKVYGKSAEYLMRNLVKKEDGSYKSRKLYLAGSIESYETTKTESLPPKELRPQDLPPQFGVLKEPIAIILTREAKETTYCFKVSFLDFEDKKKETESIEIFRSTGENGYEPQNAPKYDSSLPKTPNGGLMGIIDNANKSMDNLVEPDLNNIV